MATLRRWWWIPAVLGLTGAVLGGLAGVSAPKSATAIVNVQTSLPDADAVASAQQSALIEASSRDVMQAAAQKLGMAPKDLSAETEVGAEVKTSFLTFKATDRDAEKAARMANAVADAAVEARNVRIDEELKELTRSTSVLIQGQPLRDKSAEEARVARLGGQLADQQGQLLTQSRRLAVLQSAQADTAEGPSTMLLVAMGLLGGLLAGVALALVFGGRRGQMSSIDEMRRVYPELEFVSTRELPTLLSMEAGDVDRVVLTGVRAPAGAVRNLVEPVAAGFHAAGREVVLTEDLAAFQPDATGARPRAATLVQTPLTNAVVKRTGRDEHAMLLVLVRPRKTRFEWLDEYVNSFGDRVCVVVDG
ncbi:hypothetical protein [Mobilicoccus pelagius]|uniref:Polysaccharide chain length determinant N-terminal domain-containing protein n=1 Tax=Mobilicoccus pelagius NBRC 104925 TaxID=1089455 RepID=H5UMW0_9MICO|nr:hypothetical protein [Mobilicoccus pelagius]GAB47068.1 hypothetical protein MOPEL_003_00920 [Mobilicoccus pelagius NBRC 104925]